MDANGNVEVGLSGFFPRGERRAEVLGKQGVAVLIQPEDDYECIWVITWIDWFREVQVITNVIVTATAIKFGKERAGVGRLRSSTYRDSFGRMSRRVLRCRSIFTTVRYSRWVMHWQLVTTAVVRNVGSDS